VSPRAAPTPIKGTTARKDDTNIVAGEVSLPANRHRLPHPEQGHQHGHGWEERHYREDKKEKQ